MTEQLLGRPVWYELLTTDLKAAEKFYTTVVGWTITPFDGSPTLTTCGPGPGAFRSAAR